MADNSRDDADNEITRIVRRPGPSDLPINIMRPSNATPPASTDAPAFPSPPPAAAPANDSVPPVSPPGAFDRPRPIMTPPPRPFTPPPGAVPLPPIPSSASISAPTPVVVRPSPIPLDTRLTPAPVPASVQSAPSISTPTPTPAATPIAEPLTPAPIEAGQPTPASSLMQALAEAAKPSTPSTPIAVAAPVVAPAVMAPVAAAPVAPAPVIAAPVASPVMLPPVEPVVGWLVVIKGPGRGAAREIVTGRNGIGSAAGQALQFDFGDPAIAPQGHAYVVYDDEAREFFVEDGKQKIVVRLNGKLLTETMSLGHGDELRIGATTMRFVALCGPDFDWNEKDEKVAEAAPPVEVGTSVEVPAPVETIADEDSVAEPAFGSDGPSHW